MSAFLVVFHDARRLGFVKYARLRGFGHQDAEDIVNEVFLILHRKRTEFEGCANPDGFAFKILTNAVADHARRLDRRPLPVDQPGTPLLGRWRTGDPSDEVIPRVDLQRAFERLTERQAECLRLFYYLGLTSAEIGRFLGISASTVESHLDQGRGRLEKFLAGYDGHGNQEVNA